MIQTGDLQLILVYLCDVSPPDTDNIVKPIQDALQGIAYRNDRQIKDSMSNWRNINSKFTVRFVSMPLAVAFSIGDEFLHIRLWRSSDTEDLG